MGRGGGIDPADFEGRAKRQLEKLSTLSKTNRLDIEKAIDTAKEKEDWSPSTVRNNARNLRILAEVAESNDIDGVDEYDPLYNLNERLLDNSGVVLDALVGHIKDERDLSPGSANGYVYSARNLLKHAHARSDKDKDCLEDEAENIDEFEDDSANDEINREDTLSREDMFHLVDTVDSLRDKALIVTTWETGCRATAIASLKVKHYDKQGRQAALIHLPDEVEGLKRAGGNTKPITISLPYIDQWLNSHPRKDDDDFQDAALFCSTRPRDRGEHVRSHTVYKRIKRAARLSENVDEDEVTAHEFKHGRATEIQLSEDYTKKDAERILDWTPNTPQHKRYEHGSPEEEARRILRNRGITLDDDESVDEEVECVRCGYRVAAELNYCPSCSLRMLEGTPMWYRIYRRSLADAGQDPVVNEYNESIPPASMSELPQPVFKHVLARMVDAGLAAYDGLSIEDAYESSESLPSQVYFTLGEPSTVDIAELSTEDLSKEDGDWVVENVLYGDIVPAQLQEHAIDWQLDDGVQDIYLSEGEEAD